MKKLLLVIAIVAVGFTANAQEGQFNAGGNLLLPIGTFANGSSFGISAEANYLFELSDEFKVGPSVGLQYVFGKTIGNVTIDDSVFIPITAAARYNITEEFTLGADLGYAVGVSPDGNEGGFYYRPLVGYNISETVMLQASYNATSSSVGPVTVTQGSIGVGAMFSL